MDGLGRTTKLSLVRNPKGRSILEFIKRHNPCPKELGHVAGQLAVHEKNKVRKNAKIPRNTISLIAPKGVHNFTTTLTTKRSYFNNYITQQGWKTDPKKEEKVEERRGSGRKSLRKRKKSKKRLRNKI